MGYAETLHRVMTGNFSNASDAEKDAAVRELVKVCSVAAGAVTVQPIPFVDAALITPIQIAMRAMETGRPLGLTIIIRKVLDNALVHLSLLRIHRRVRQR